MSRTGKTVPPADVEPLGSRRKRSGSRKTLEPYFVGLLVTLVFTVALVQGLLRYDDIRRVLNSAIRLEGEPLSRVVPGVEKAAYPWFDWPFPEGAHQTFVYFRFLSEPQGKVWAIRDGRPVKEITPDDGVVTCAEGEILEVLIEKGEVRLVVSDTAPNLLFPSVSTLVSGSGRILVGAVETR